MVIQPEVPKTICLEPEAPEGFFPGLEQPTPREGSLRQLKDPCINPLTVVKMPAGMEEIVRVEPLCHERSSTEPETYYIAEPS